MLNHHRTGEGEKQLTDVNNLCDEYLNLSYHGMRANVPNFNCVIVKKLATNLPEINIIPQDISRVFLNLFNNAFYAVKDKADNQKPESDYKPTVSFTTLIHGNKVVLKVRDNGNGIPKELKEKIFEPFFTTKPAGQGTGLGLSLSYDIIKVHNGEISVESKDGEYTEFKIKLPI